MVSYDKICPFCLVIYSGFKLVLVYTIVYGDYDLTHYKIWLIYYSHAKLDRILTNYYGLHLRKQTEQCCDWWLSRIMVFRQVRPRKLPQMPNFIAHATITLTSTISTQVCSDCRAQSLVYLICRARSFGVPCLHFLALAPSLTGV